MKAAWNEWQGHPVSLLTRFLLFVLFYLLESQPLYTVCAGWPRSENWLSARRWAAHPETDPLRIWFWQNSSLIVTRDDGTTSCCVMMIVDVPAGVNRTVWLHQLVRGNTLISWRSNFKQRVLHTFWRCCEGYPLDGRASGHLPYI